MDLMTRSSHQGVGVNAMQSCISRQEDMARLLCMPSLTQIFYIGAALCWLEVDRAVKYDANFKNCPILLLSSRCQEYVFQRTST